MKTVIITGGNSGLGYYCAHNKAKLLWDRSVELTQLKSEETILELLPKLLLNLARLLASQAYRYLLK